MLVADVVEVALCVFAGVACALKSRAFHHGRRRELSNIFRLSHFFAFGNQPCSGELSLLSCGIVLLERGFLSLGVRVSNAMRFHSGGFEDCVFH